MLQKRERQQNEVDRLWKANKFTQREGYAQEEGGEAAE
jgi:hypothetical protein